MFEQVLFGQGGEGRVRERDLGRLGSPLQPCHSRWRAAGVGLVGVHQVRQGQVDKLLVEVVATEVVVAVAGQHLDHVALQVDHRDVEGAAAQVENRPHLAQHQALGDLWRPFGGHGMHGLRVQRLACGDDGAHAMAGQQFVQARQRQGRALAQAASVAPCACEPADHRRRLPRSMGLHPGLQAVPHFQQAEQQAALGLALGFGGLCA